MDSYAEELEKIMSVLKTTPRGMSVSDIAAHISLNRNTVSRYLDMLRISGQVDMKNYGKAKVFFISQRAPISAIINFSSDMVVVLDSSQVIVQTNDHLCNMIGVAKEDLIGEEIRNSSLVGFDHPLINNKIQAALEGEETTDEIRIVKGGAEQFYRIRIIPTVLSDSSPGVTIILEDITEKKVAEEALKDSEKNYRSLVEEINDAILDLDEEYNVTYASPRTSHILGQESGAILGKSLLEFIEDEDKRVDVETFFSGICTNGGSAELFECSVMNSAGKPVSLESSICPKYDEMGVLTGFRIVCRDITERNKVYRDLFKWKSFLNSIFENIPTMVMVKEMKKGRYIFFNRASEEFFGLDRKKANGKMGCELFHDKITEYLISGDSEVVSTGNSIEMPDLRINMPRKGERILRVRKSPVKGPDSTLEYIMTIADDITSIRKAEEETVRQRDMAQGYLDVAGVMIAVIREDGTIERLNKKGCEMTGYSENEILGRDWFSLFVPEEIRNTSKKTFEEIVSGNLVPYPDKIGTIMRKDGTEKEVIWQNTLLRDNEGNITAMVSSASESRFVE